MLLAYQNGQIEIFNFNRIELVKTILFNQSEVNHLILLANGDLVSGSKDGQINRSKMLESN